jgi:F-type H+-transporting ATPase subunit b
MPQFDVATFPTQLFWLVLTFAVLYAVMLRFALPRISEVLEARRSHIDHDLEAAEKLKSEAEQALAAYEKLMANAKSEAQAVIRRAGEELAAEAAVRQGELAKHLAAQTKSAETRIEQAKAQALAGIKTVAAQAAELATAKLIGVAVGEGAAQAAVDQVMAGRK